MSKYTSQAVYASVENLILLFYGKLNFTLTVGVSII